MENNANKKVISIIVPVYNSENYLRDCINSILEQTYKNIECILVDDCSNDKSSIICDELAILDSRVKVIHHKKNMGLSKSRYDGYKVAIGDYISFVDNDDYIATWFYEELISNIGDASICSLGGADISNEIFNDESIKLNEKPRLNSKIITGKESLKMYINLPKEYGEIQCTWGKIYSRKHVDKVIRVTERYADAIPWLFLEDVVFSPISFSLSDKSVFLDGVGYLHRVIKTSLSMQACVKPYRYETAEASDIVLEFSKKNGLTQLYEKYIESALANLQSIWYKINTFEVNMHKKAEGGG